MTHSSTMRAWRALMIGGVAALAAACADGPVTEPPVSLNPTPPPPPSGFLNLCKVGPDGSVASFTVSATDGILLLGGNVDVLAGTCVRVWEDFQPAEAPDPEIFVTITEVGLPDGIEFDNIEWASIDNGQGAIDLGARQIVARLNAFHSGTATFYNSEVPPPPSGGGCTPGFWKNPKRYPLWGYAPGTSFASVFEDAFPNMTLENVINLGGGGLNALGRHTVAALLNAASSEVDYGMTPQQVIDAFNAEFPGGDYEGLKNAFEALNTREEGTAICS